MNPVSRTNSTPEGSLKKGLGRRTKVFFLDSLAGLIGATTAHFRRCYTISGYCCPRQELRASAITRMPWPQLMVSKPFRLARPCSNPGIVASFGAKYNANYLFSKQSTRRSKRPENGSRLHPINLDRDTLASVFWGRWVGRGRNTRLALLITRTSSAVRLAPTGRGTVFLPHRNQKNPSVPT